MPYDVPAERIDELLDVVAQAFGPSADPVSDYVFECEADPQAFKERFFRAIAKACLPTAFLQASSERLEAISIWTPPAIAHEDDGPAELFDVAEFRSPETGVRLARMLQSIESATTSLGSGPQWYLHVLATRPKYQGQGYTSALLTSVFARADSDQVPCTLICPQHNVPVYEHFGFRVISTTKFTGTSMSMYCMQRDPQS